MMVRILYMEKKVENAMIKFQFPYILITSFYALIPYSCEKIAMDITLEQTITNLYYLHATF